MNEPDTFPREPAAPFASLLRCRDVRIVWMLRMLFRVRGCSDIASMRHRGLVGRLNQRLRLPLFQFSDDQAVLQFLARLEATHRRLEKSAHLMAMPACLASNMAFLGRHFAFNRTESAVLALAVCLRADDTLHDLAEATGQTVDPVSDIAAVLKLPKPGVARTLEPDSRLRRSGLIEAVSGGSLACNLTLRRGGLRKIASVRIRRIEELLSGILTSAPPPTLAIGDYAHLTLGIDVLERVLRDALTRRREGVNVLVYGSPGTGKTELARVLAQAIDVPLFDVSSQDENGSPLGPMYRLGAAAAGLFLLGKRRALVAFDEVEAIFGDGSDFSGRTSTADSAKAWVNQLLETNSVPVMWMTNGIERMDPAFVRRFDLVVQLESPPRSQRLALLQRELGDLVPMPRLRRLASVEALTPALVTRASRVVRRVGTSKDSGVLLEALLDSVLKAQGVGPLARLASAEGSGGFDPALCNASVDLKALASGLTSSRSGRICLYGPPGTGKSAFGHWLAGRLDKPIILKRVSDLQSPYVGVMEQNLARAFEEATRSGAVLQIDEVDSFLRHRDSARHAWEVSQANEFLVQLEAFAGILIATTNLKDNIDLAALRRFDYKIWMDFLRWEQSLAMLGRTLSACGLSKPAREIEACLDKFRLTPGDFSVVARRHVVAPFQNAREVVAAVCEEAAVAGRSSGRRIGFT